MKRSRRATNDDTTKTADRPPLVLLVDDFQDNREMYAMYLEHAGMQVAEAGNGHEALDQAFRLLPDLIVMDLSLPGIDGWEATRRLKADERTKKMKPAVVETRRPSPARAKSTPPETGGDSLGKYVYCVIQADDPQRFGPIGIGAKPSEVHTINYKDIAAVVSDTPLEVYDPTRENVLAHEKVNEAVMRQHTVIPMSFGTVFKTRDDIVELLRGAYDAFRDVLNKMEDKLEFGLKILWDRDVMIREIEKQDEDVRRLKGEIATQKGSTYFARVQYGRLVDAALGTLSE